MISRLLLIVLLCMTALPLLSKDSSRGLLMREFLERAARNDPAFQVILADALYSRYSKRVQLPASDIVLSVTGQYNLVIHDSSGSSGTNYTGGSTESYLYSLYSSKNDSNTGTGSFEGSIALSKLFPMTGTELKGQYSVMRNYIQGNYLTTSSFSAEVSQPIARNAFGKATRKLDRKIGVENELAKHQVVEAYEDYLASLMVLYMDWYSAWENLKAARSIHGFTKDLLAMIQKKRRYRVALPEDVEKMRLEVITAEEELVNREDSYNRYTMKIREAAVIKKKLIVTPVNPRISSVDITLNRDYIDNDFLKSRSAKMMTFLERKGMLAVDISKDNILPSVILFAGYNLRGQDYSMKGAQHSIYAGVTSSIGFMRRKERAELGIARADLKKTRLANRSALKSLKISIETLLREIDREKRLRELYSKKKKISERILKAEKRNYTMGRATLNDLIMVMNNLTTIRYNEINHAILYKRLLIEWKRLTDSLVVMKDVPLK